MKKLIICGLVVTLMGCSKPIEQKVDNTNEPVKTSVPSEEDISIPSQEEVNANLKKLSLVEFINNLKPRMKDTLNEHPESAGLLAYFLNLKNTKINDINQISSTTKGKILKDSELEKGKRLCIDSTIVEIAADRSGGFSAYQGVMVDDTMQPYVFMAVGDTGDLVSQSQAKFCGITVGKMSYSNAGGGTSTAPYIVGLFNLPANR